MRRPSVRAVALLSAALWCSAVLPAFVPSAGAADGSGTAVVTPTSVNAGSTGNAMTFTYTAAETMNSGEVSLTVPAGWSVPQGTPGVAGYTTAASAGTVGTVLGAADSLTDWSAGTACLGGLAIDTAVKQEGTGSIRCTNGNQADGNLWYKNISAQNWSAYTKVAFWIRTSSAIGNANELRFAYDDGANLASPIEQIILSQTLAANTWTYVVMDLGATTRTSVTSFGLVIRHGGNLDNVVVWVDDFLLGPGVPTFPGGGVISTRLLQLTSGQTMTLTYGSGGGASGAAAPPSGQTSVFNAATRISDSGTLTPIASSPLVTVWNPVPTTSSIVPTTTTAGGSNFMLTVNGTNFVPTSVVRFNGSDRATTYVSPTQLTAAILSSDVAAPGSNSVTIFNQTPGGGTSSAQTFTVTADSTAPSAITNLSLSSPTTSSMVLTWTAPGDDGAAGTASLYDIRYATAPIVTAGDFTAAALVSGEPVPAVAGTVQNMTVNGLSANTTYYFAMKTQDEVPNVSLVSNVPSLATVASPDSVPPAVVTNLALSSPTTSSIVLTWTAPGDDGAAGTASLYDIRYATAPIVTAADFTAAAEVLGEPVPAVAGTVQNMTVTELSANTTYYFAMKTRDEVPNVSAVSNVPSLATAANPDVTAPTAITDLVLSGPTTSSLTLFWTAPGDDGTVGTAALYDIRYSTAPITTAADFSVASLVSGEPIPPSTAGTVQNMTVTGLSANTTYYFAMKTQDEVPNVSLVSNVPSLATSANPDATAPSAVTNLAASSPTTSSLVLTWTAPGDDGDVGTAYLYDIRYATAPIVTLADFSAAALVTGEPIPTAAGTTQTRTVTGLSANTTYYFAMKSQDEVPNVSAVSNVPSFATSANPDATAPSAVTNLAASSPTTSSLVLTWTAPGDDGAVGTAALFDLRYSTAPIVTLADFTAAALVSGEPVPAVSGTVQNMTVTGLSANTTYFFAIKSQDEVPNISAVSNVATRSTAADPDTAAPSAIADLSLSGAGTISMTLNWTAPGDDGMVGTAALYDIRYATSAIVTPADFAAATQVTGEPAPASAGTQQSMSVAGLSPSTTYFFAMKTQDEAPNISAVSNVPSRATISAGGGGGGGTSDVSAPAAVTNLALSSPTASSMTLSWTAPGDDGNNGTAFSYDIRYATSPFMSNADFTLATQLTGEPAPALADTPQSMTALGLAAGVTYYFAMKTQDEVPNLSALSNVPSLATVGGGGGGGGGGAADTTAPVNFNISVASITRSSAIVTWETLESGNSLARYGTSAPLTGSVSEAVMTTRHSLPIVGLAAGTTYRYEVCARDAAGNQGCSATFMFTTLPADAPDPAYGAAEELVASPTINIDKGLVAPPFGPAASCVSGALIKLPDDGNAATQSDSTVYYCGADGKRYVFPDLGTYRSWYPDFSGVTVVSASVLADVPLGGNVTYRPGKFMLKIQTDPKVYAVARGGVLRWVTSESVALSLYGLLWNDLVYDISDAFFADYRLGEPIHDHDVPPPVIVTEVTPPPPSDCTTSTTFTVFLTRGSDDPQVLPLQALLGCLGHLAPDVPQTGHFGPATEAAVKSFQTANGIDPLGYVGPATRAALNRYVAP